MSSILTNTAAMSALRTLSNTQQTLQTTENRISSGLKVATASDNAAYWSIATTMQSDNQTLGSVSNALNLGSSLVDTATSGLTQGISILQTMQTDLVTAKNPGTDMSKIQSDISVMQSELKSIATSASFSGQNWLSGDSAGTGSIGNASIVSSFSRSGSAVTVGTINVNVDAVMLYDPNTGGSGAAGILDKSRTVNSTTGSIGGIDVSTLTSSSADQQTLSDYSQMVDDALKEMTTASATLGATKNSITIQQNFISSLTDAVTKGVGALVDADMNQESTKLQALQVQQQLGIQSLSIANQNSQMILKLFGG